VNNRIESLHMLERACWRELERAGRERDHDWRVMTLATVDGSRADARSVIVREVVESSRTLRFYTDDRSAKLRQLQACPQAMLVGWSRTLSWQLRLQVTLVVEDDGLEVSSRWARVKLSPSAQDYLAALPPGTPVDRYTPERGSREHFAVVRAEVQAIDWLELHPEGHRRARFAAEGATWLSP
jgi:pyridoxamine 5'-phosphate oxidase